MNNNTLVTCPVCEGSGLDTTQDSTCPMCGGIGSVTKAEHDEYDTHMSALHPTQEKLDELDDELRQNTMTTITLSSDTLTAIYYDMHHLMCMAKDRYKDNTGTRERYHELADLVAELEAELEKAGLSID